ncbi:MAG: SDR family NAD(P)-dependent oxidoreductase [candidate division Zixibacteria bacterium]|nr:SDR family NAD(P)-dependent oxidoreductase [candidate division Zixibacteria bacterium]
MSKTALITGASSGLGVEFAKIHAGHGDNLVLIARREDKLNQLKNDLLNHHDIDIVVFPQDLSNPESTGNIRDFCNDNDIHIDYLINNAGFGGYGYFHETDAGRYDNMMKVNMLALTRLTRAFLPDMVKCKSGRILNIASTAAFVPGPMQAVYYASKAYVLSFTEAVANELQGTGVSATVLCPGATRTEFFDVAGFDESSFKLMGVASAKSCAEYGYKSMMNGKVVAIHGFRNKLMLFTIRFSPRWLVRRIVRSMQQQ